MFAANQNIATYDNVVTAYTHNGSFIAIPLSRDPDPEGWAGQVGGASSCPALTRGKKGALPQVETKRTQSSWVAEGLPGWGHLVLTGGIYLSGRSDFILIQGCDNA
jgi:hypothetical protein